MQLHTPAHPLSKIPGYATADTYSWKQRHTVQRNYTWAAELRDPWYKLTRMHAC